MGVRNCLKCNGLLVHEDDEWRCFLCGRYYYSQQSPLPENDVPQRKTWRNYNSVGYRDESLTLHDITSILGLPPSGYMSGR